MVLLERGGGGGLIKKKLAFRAGLTCYWGGGGLIELLQ